MSFLEATGDRGRASAPIAALARRFDRGRGASAAATPGQSGPVDRLEKWIECSGPNLGSGDDTARPGQTPMRARSRCNISAKTRPTALQLGRDLLLHLKRGSAKFQGRGANIRPAIERGPSRWRGSQQPTFGDATGAKWAAREPI